jgi:hypothetical protein
MVEIIFKKKTVQNKKSRMGTHPSKSTRQKRTQVETTQIKNESKQSRKIR